MRDRLRKRCKKLKEAGLFYRRQFQWLDHLVRSQSVVALDCKCVDGDRTSLRISCVFSHMKKPILVPRDMIDVGSEVWEDGDEGALVVDALWAYRNNLIEFEDAIND